MEAILSVGLPLLARVTVWAALDVPTCWFENTTLPGVRATTAPSPVPLRLMKCGDPAASSVIEIDPVRSPDVVGVKLTENVQLPAAGTLVPQLSVSAKSDASEMAEIHRGELPMSRSRT